MPGTIPTTSLPVPAALSSTPWSTDNNLFTGAVIPRSNAINGGETTVVPGKLNENFTKVDLTSAFAACPGIYSGGTLTNGGGANLNIAAIKALIGGVVEKKTSTVYVVPLASTVYMYFKQDGTFTHVAGSTTPPAGNVIFIGVVITDGAGITSISDDGVMYIRNGVPFREVGDLGKPADSPAAMAVHICRTQGGTWLWSGAEYLHLTEDLPQTKESIAGTVVIPSGFQSLVYGTLTVTGRLTINGKLRVIP